MLGRDKVMPNEFLEGEVLEADCVISTLPVWNVLRVVPESALPDWYVAQIRYLAQDHAADLVARALPRDARGDARARPARALDLAARADRRGSRASSSTSPRWTRRTAPEGVNLMVAGGIIPGAKAQGPRLPHSACSSTSRTT